MGLSPTGLFSLPSPGLRAGLAAAALVLLGAPAAAQDYQLCVRLEARLVQLDRESRGGGATDGQYRAAIAEAQRRLAAARHEAERAGCGQQQGFLFFRPPRTLSCLPYDEEMDRLEANLRNMQLRAPGSGAGRPDSAAIASERRNILAMLGEKGCGPQYERYGRPRTASAPGMFLRDYARDPFLQSGPPNNTGNFHGGGRGSAFYGTYRTLCVRSCDGYYWPISFSTVESHFGYDNQLCQRSCPGSSVALYVHRNPGEGPDQAISLAGQPYSISPNAFRYRDEYVADCSCNGGVQTAALGSYRPGERVSVSLAARNGTLPPDVSEPSPDGRPRQSTGWGNLQFAPPVTGPGPASEPAVDKLVAVPDEIRIVRLTPVPRPRPGNEIPVAGSIATLTGQEDFLAVPAPVRAEAADGTSVRVVGPGFTLYRSGGE
ncbi:DUF2865 domain-containing protein [Microbaculum marinum]|uniref:DUF2865 domain-containing protein n=1 Tax=Microbaculum marinum TaxID=1764581 RepID=A0AAW9RVJ1_9HYPH